MLRNVKMLFRYVTYYLFWFRLSSGKQHHNFYNLLMSLLGKNNMYKLDLSIDSSVYVVVGCYTYTVAVAVACVLVLLQFQYQRTN